VTLRTSSSAGKGVSGGQRLEKPRGRESRRFSGRGYGRNCGQWGGGKTKKGGRGGIRKKGKTVTVKGPLRRECPRGTGTTEKADYGISIFTLPGP